MGSFNFLKSKKVAIFSLGVTGIAVYKALRNITEKIIVWDDNLINRHKFAADFDANQLVDPEDSQWTSIDIIIPGPGIPLSHNVMQMAKADNIEILSDIDIFYEQCGSAKFIGITGTNGKSTTTALIHHILKHANFDFAVGGNIGVPVLELPIDKPGYVLELSSFQLELVKKFRTDIAILLNITPDHLDRHKTMADYINAKEKILNLTNDGWGIINVDNNITKNIFEKYRINNKNLIPISVYNSLPNGISVIDDKIFDNLSECLVLDLPRNKFLQGDHNKENIATSIAVCRTFKIPYNTIIEAIQSFKGLAHRAEYLGVHENINFYNDSKATNAEAAAKSISFLDNIYWLLGGIAKEGGIDQLIPLFSKIRKAYLFGQDSQLFAKTLSNKVEFKIFKDLKSAFAAAYSDALNDKLENKNILLAPAAASLDQFKSFEHRGETFRQLYNNIKENND